MFSPEIAKKASHLLNSNVEIELKMLFDDLIQQNVSKIKANMPDSELRILAVNVELLEKLKNYRKHIKDTVERHGNS